MPKAIRNAYGEALVKYGKNNRNVVVFDADVSTSTKSSIFAKACPDRFFNCGISEYAMVGMAAGMAHMGKITFVNAFAAFLTTLGLTGIRAFLAYSGENVKLVGGYSGLSDTYNGALHHSLEDISIMRDLPGMTVLVASDELITDWLVKTAVDTKRPMYLRLSRTAMPICHSEDTRYEIGKGITVREGSDVTVIACGLMVSAAVKAAKRLEYEGISVKVVDMFSIKPIDRELIIASAKDTGAVVTAEEHGINGGLGSAVCEVLAEEGIGVPTERVGIRDTFTESGAYSDVLHKYGLDEAGLCDAVRRVCLRKKK